MWCLAVLCFVTSASDLLRQGSRIGIGIVGHLLGLTEPRNQSTLFHEAKWVGSRSKDGLRLRQHTGCVALHFDAVFLFPFV